MFNSTLTVNAQVWFDELPPESIDSYDDLREAFLKNYLQQKKSIKDPFVLHKHHVKDGESTEDIHTKIQVESWKRHCGAPECMIIIEAALNQERKKTLPTWKHQEGSHRQDFKKGGSFRIQLVAKGSKAEDISKFLSHPTIVLYGTMRGAERPPDNRSRELESPSATA
ncbi:reverse transcriptase domain-containing protein [Tanacetum coccineum]